tara:strand:- start:2383 stop:3096 length:714 start_codon:yes stop_codon:yes gene_type:complete
MATITVNVDLEGWVERIDTSGATINWTTTTRNAATGTDAYTRTTSATEQGTRSYYVLSKGVYQSMNARSFFFFDTSGVGGTISAAVLKVYAGSPGNSVDTIVVEGTAWGDSGDGTTTTLSTGDYDSLGLTTPYSDPKLSWTASAYNNYALNATAIADMNANGYLNTALITDDYDYKPQSPTLGDDWSVAINYANGSFPHYLDITYTPSGFGNNVNGWSSYSNINGVATADISQVNGV